MRALLVCILLSPPAIAQYAPQAGIAGSTAIPAASPLIKGWAAGCRIQRGLQDIAQPGLGPATAGDSTMATGAQDGTVASLGDGGTAVLTFALPIADGPGADFAVFENGFPNPQNSEEAFLELAFVEVSSDGVLYVRFPAQSGTQTGAQIAGAGDYMNARLINNLAGKYRSGFGTPFDLAELANTPGLDVTRITHVRIRDVVGTLGTGASLDSAGRKINDPYPTPYPTGGFDLDAVAVMNASLSQEDAGANASSVFFSPNPATGLVRTTIPPGAYAVRVVNSAGQTVSLTQASGAEISVDLTPFPPGLYQIILSPKNAAVWSGKVLRR